MIHVACPNCAKNFRLNDTLAGKKGRCVQCQAVFEIPRQPTAVLAAAQPMGQPAMLDPRWRTLWTGLTVSRIGLLMLFLGSVAITFLAHFKAVNNGAQDLIGSVALLAVPLVLLGSIIQLTGWFICSAGPARSGVRGWAVAAGLFACAGIAITFVLSSLPGFAPSGAQVGLVGMAGNGVVFAIVGGAVATMCFAGSLCAVARTLGRPGAAVSAIFLNILLALNCGWTLVMTYSQRPPTSTFAQMFTNFSPLVAAVWLLILTTVVLDAVRKHMRHFRLDYRLQPAM